jgi:hypothetical protein
MEHGTVLSYLEEGICAETNMEGEFKQWMLNNIDSWLAFTVCMGMDVNMEDIILISAYD